MLPAARAARGLAAFGLASQRGKSVRAEKDQRPESWRHRSTPERPLGRAKPRCLCHSAFRGIEFLDTTGSRRTCASARRFIAFRLGRRRRLPAFRFRSSIPSLCIPLSNASSAASRLPSHGSGPGWFATPFLYDSFIHCSTPVYPDAILPTGDSRSPSARSVDESRNQSSACPTPSAEKANANRAETPHDATGRRSPASPPLAPPPSGTRRAGGKPRRLGPTRSTSTEDAGV